MSVAWENVAETIRGIETADGCTLGVAITAPTGERFGHNAERPFLAASTVKIAIMVEFYRQTDAGERRLTDIFELRESDKAPGSGVLLHFRAGAILTLEDLVYLMMSISDNTATNLLIDLLGMDRISETMRSQGMAASTLGRRMMGRPAQGSESENWAAPGDYARILAAILDGTAASARSCAQMTEMLERQQNDRRIARCLPKTDRPRWGSKTGTLTGTTNDVGFVFGPGGPTILSIFCARPSDPHTAEQIIGEVSRAALRATGHAI